MQTMTKHRAPVSPAAGMRTLINKPRRGWAICHGGCVVFGMIARALPTCALVALAFVGAASAFAEETVFTATGRRGDIAYNDNCAPGEYMVGMKGGQGAWIDRIGIMCMPMTSRGVLSGPVKYDHPEFGGPGGGAFSKRCKPNYFVGGYSAQLTEDSKRVQLLKLYCVSHDEATWPRYFLVAGSEALPGRTFSNDCPTGQIGSGLHGNSGKDVNSVALVCRTAVTPPGTPPPAKSMKPVKHMSTGNTTPRADPCIEAQTAREKHMPASLISIFEKQCRLRGGDPNAPAAPPPIDNGGGGASAATDTTVYDKPDGNDIAYLNAGDPVTIVSCNSNNWCQISKPRRGWVWGEDLKR